MTDKDLLARFESLVTAWNDRDVDRIVAAFSPEARFYHAATRRVSFGREAVRADAEALLRAIPDLKLEIRRTFAARSVVTCEWTARGTWRVARANAARAVERDGVLIADYDGAGQVLGFIRYATPTFAVRTPATDLDGSIFRPPETAEVSGDSTEAQLLPLGIDTPMKRTPRKLPQ
jgi:SnoaL-like polyketide cyclase